jgi:hypothetical protein
MGFLETPEKKVAGFAAGYARGPRSEPAWIHEFLASACLKVHTSDQRRVDLDQACFVVEARSADAVGSCKCQDKAVSNEPPHFR